jgi:hypothetical protein
MEIRGRAVGLRARPEVQYYIGGNMSDSCMVHYLDLNLNNGDSCVVFEW